MIFSRHIYWVILLHVMLILVTSGTGAWLIISQRGFVIGTLLITCSLFQISRLVNKLNSFNQKLRVFFDAIEDKDNMLYFPEQNVSKEQEKLNRSQPHQFPARQNSIRIFQTGTLLPLTLGRSAQRCISMGFYRKNNHSKQHCPYLIRLPAINPIPTTGILTARKRQKGAPQSFTKPDETTR